MTRDLTLRHDRPGLREARRIHKPLVARWLHITGCDYETKLQSSTVLFKLPWGLLAPLHSSLLFAGIGMTGLVRKVVLITVERPCR